MKSSRLLARAFALVLLFAAIAAAQDAPALRTVVRPVLNMYSSATGEADVVSQAIYATNVAVIEEKDGWARIRTPDDYTGWVETSGLLARPGAPYASRGTVVQVRSLFAHLYREDSVTKHAPLLTVPFETSLEIDPDGHGDRALVAGGPADGRRAMVQKSDVTPAGATLNIDDAIALAKAIRRAAVHVGWHVELRLRLLRFHADAHAAARLPACPVTPACRRSGLGLSR